MQPNETKALRLKINLGILLLLFLSGCSYLTNTPQVIANPTAEIKQEQKLPITATAKFEDNTIQLEVAQTPEQQARGLMFRRVLADDRGMLFPFASPRIASFWMKNVPISLDMVFLSGDPLQEQDYLVVNIAADVPPCKAEPCPIYGSDALINKVLELRGGRAKELGLEVGDKLTIHPLDSSKEI